MKNFKNLMIWSTGIEIAKSAYTLCKKLPREERYGLISQITRAAVSIPANIAEGGSRSSDKQYVQFINIAQGSAYELETLLIIARETQNIDTSEIEPLLDQVTAEQRMLSAFLNKLKQKLVA